MGFKLDKWKAVEKVHSEEMLNLRVNFDKSEERLLQAIENIRIESRDMHTGHVTKLDEFKGL